MKQTLSEEFGPFLFGELYSFKDKRGAERYWGWIWLTRYEFVDFHHPYFVISGLRYSSFPRVTVFNRDFVDLLDVSLKKRASFDRSIVDQVQVTVDTLSRTSKRKFFRYGNEYDPMLCQNIIKSLSIELLKIEY